VALGRPGLQSSERLREALALGWHPFGHRASRAATRGKTADRDRPSSLKRIFGLGETLATTLIGLWLPGSRRR
jgi:hypothetical protein